MVAFAAAVACAGGAAVSCVRADTGGEESGEVGSVQVALLGTGSLGGQYKLQGATFTITGQTSTSLSGDPDALTTSLPVGQYTVKLESGWTLGKVSDAGTTVVTAELASPNPQSFIVNSAQTTSVTLGFNVSGTGATDDDLELVTIGNGTASFSTFSGEDGFANFSADSFHTCGITKAGQLKCWGSNGNGQLGYGDTTSRTVPAATAINVGSGRTVKRVVVSRNSNSHTCALLDDATVKCWGLNSSGQLGYGDTTSRTSPSTVAVNLGTGNTARSIAIGGLFTCAILDTFGVKCWGTNANSELGNGSNATLTAPAATPINLGPGMAAQEIVAGSNHACALLNDNTVTCWGLNSSGQLGYGNTTGLQSPGGPVPLGTGRTARRLAAGYNHTCAILDDGTVKCWGANGSGQLGYGDTTARTSPATTPVNLGVGRTAKLITAGAAHTCAQLDDNTIRCWGSNTSGQLGYEDVTLRSAPTTVAVNLGTGRTARRLLASSTATCVLLTDNGVTCWGNNNSGMFGVGTPGDTRGDQVNEMGDNLPEVLP